MVFYQDGFVRIGYNQTSPHILKNDRNVVSMDELETYLLKQKKKKKYHNRNHHADNIMIHIRNQIKSSLVQLIDAFQDKSFRPSKKQEDGFELFCTDFVLQSDGNVVLWHSPYSDTIQYAAYSMSLEDHYWLLQKHHEVFYSTMTILTEIWNKQLSQQNNDDINFLPMEHTGLYQLLYAKNVQDTEAN